MKGALPTQAHNLMSCFRISLLYTLGWVVLLTGCSEPSAQSTGPFYPALDATFHTDSTAEATLFARLQSIDTTPLRDAIAALEDTPFRATVSVKQATREGQVDGIEKIDIGFSPPNSLEVYSRNIEDSFQFGVLHPFASGSSVEVPRMSASHLLPDDPAYLAPRSREAYTYIQGRDTMLLGQIHQVIEVAAKPGAGDAQPIRRVRYFVEPQSNTLSAFYLIHHQKAFLFYERSQHFVQFNPARAQALPDSIHLQTVIKTPFRSSESYTLQVKYHPVE